MTGCAAVSLTRCGRRRERAGHAAVGRRARQYYSACGGPLGPQAGGAQVPQVGAQHRPPQRAPAAHAHPHLFSPGQCTAALGVPRGCPRHPPHPPSLPSGQPRVSRPARSRWGPRGGRRVPAAEGSRRLHRGSHPGSSSPRSPRPQEPSLTPRRPSCTTPRPAAWRQWCSTCCRAACRRGARTPRQGAHRCTRRPPPATWTRWLCCCSAAQTPTPRTRRATRPCMWQRRTGRRRSWRSWCGQARRGVGPTPERLTLLLVPSVCVRVLQIDAGCDVAITNGEDRTAWSVALTNGHKQYAPHRPPPHPCGLNSLPTTRVSLALRKRWSELVGGQEIEFTSAALTHAQRDTVVGWARAGLFHKVRSSP